MEMKITKIIDREDRKLLYGSRPDYYLIAPTGATVKIGDTVRYEPDGINFGWLK